MSKRHYNPKQAYRYNPRCSCDRCDSDRAVARAMNEDAANDPPPDATQQRYLDALAECTRQAEVHEATPPPPATDRPELRAWLQVGFDLRKAERLAREQLRGVNALYK